MDILDYFRKIDSISAGETKKALESRDENTITLIDVRQPEEYERGHIPGAQFIPLADILERKEEIDPSKTVITYCARGRRSKSAALLLQGQGFANVLSMEGGIEAWEGSTARGQYEEGMYLLEGRETVEELISLAWALEEGTRTFYEHVRNLVDDIGAQKVFDALIKAEAKHKRLLFHALENMQGKEHAEDIISRETLRGVMEGGISVERAKERVNEGRSVEDIMEMSMQIEVNSLDLYFKISRHAMNKEVTQALHTLIEEEKTHLAWLGKMIGKLLGQQTAKD